MILMTKEQLDAAPDDIRPVRIEFTFTDGHLVIAEGEGARAMYRFMLNGQQLEGDNANKQG